MFTQTLSSSRVWAFPGSATTDRNSTLNPPSPQPSPFGRGGLPPAFDNVYAVGFSECGRRFSLSLRERGGVSGKKPHGRRVAAIARRAPPSIVGLLMLVALLLSSPVVVGAPALEIPAKLVVLTFDDAVKSQRTFVAPLLK